MIRRGRASKADEAIAYWKNLAEGRLKIETVREASRIASDGNLGSLRIGKLTELLNAALEGKDVYEVAYPALAEVARAKKWSWWPF